MAGAGKEFSFSLDLTNGTTIKEGSLVAVSRMVEGKMEGEFEDTFAYPVRYFGIVRKRLPSELLLVEKINGTCGPAEVDPRDVLLLAPQVSAEDIALTMDSVVSATIVLNLAAEIISLRKRR